MYFTADLEKIDNDIYMAVQNELKRQQNQIELIASENIVSKAVLEAQGTILTNKYAEGYAHKRYYGGCEFVDVIEDLAVARAKELFGCEFVNVQPHSGSQANTAVYLALLQPGDTILGMSLDAGGHLTHGSKVSISGKWFNAVQYGVIAGDCTIDYAQLEELAIKHQPKLIIAGGSAYPRLIDFAKFREVADKVGAYLMVDMAHFAGLVAGGAHPSPVPFADVVTTTTHKTLRGPRGGMILTNCSEIAKKINSAVFPGSQGGPLMHVIAGKAVCFKEALNEDFKTYATQVVKNAKILGEVLKKRGLNLVSGGTDNHLLLVDLTPKGLTGDVVSEALEQANIACNKNTIPNDPRPPRVTSGIRVGSPAGTTRGFKEAEFEMIANFIGDIVDALAAADIESVDCDICKAAEVISVIRNTKEKVIELCSKFPIYA